jgi:tRNA pseudouridine55 synthase
MSEKILKLVEKGVRGYPSSWNFRRHGGIIVVDKPVGVITSRLVAHFREILQDPQEESLSKRRIPGAKVGHGGVLDCPASGVVILGVGAATKLLSHFLTNCTKSYVVQGRFGMETDTQDNQYREITHRASFSHVTRELLEDALSKFRGSILQETPIYSNRKVEGNQLFHLAQNSKIPRVSSEEPTDCKDVRLANTAIGLIPPKPMFVHYLAVNWFRRNVEEENETLDFELTVTASSGFYVRQLVTDIGRTLNSAAFTLSIDRTQVGPFHRTDALPSRYWKDQQKVFEHMEKNYPKLDLFITRQKQLEINKYR